MTEEFDVDPRILGVIGFSAGASLAANLVTHTERNVKSDYVDSTSCRPDFAIGVYGAYEPIRHNLGFVPFGQLVNKNTPSFFLVHALNDTVVFAQQSLNFFAALRQVGVPVELHLYETGKHGFALETDRGVVISWANLLLDWLRVRKVLQ